jgi:hypothetical protein
MANVSLDFGALAATVKHDPNNVGLACVGACLSSESAQGAFSVIAAFDRVRRDPSLSSFVERVTPTAVFRTNLMSFLPNLSAVLIDLVAEYSGVIGMKMDLVAK